MILDACGRRSDIFPFIHFEIRRKAELIALAGAYETFWVTVGHGIQVAVLVLASSTATAAQDGFLGELCSNKCAATVFAGIQWDTSMQEAFGAKGTFTPPWQYEFSKGFFLGGTLSRELVDLFNVVGIETELGVGQRFGTLHEQEAWGAIYLRWKYFPWNDYVRTTFAVSTGVNYASDVPSYEKIYSLNGHGSRVLHYFSPEITFARPSNPNTELVFRLHHRSGGRDWWGESHPLFGNIFHNTGGGVQYATIGLRQRF